MFLVSASRKVHYNAQDENKKVTGTGKVRYKKQGLRHILTKKSSKRKGNLRASGILEDMEAKRAKSMLPYA